MNHEWRSIETAPKDREILLVTAGGLVESSRWLTHPITRDGGWWAGEWKYRTPTHWMPLPQPPSTAGESEKTEKKP